MENFFFNLQIFPSEICDQYLSHALPSDSNLPHFRFIKYIIALNTTPGIRPWAILSQFFWLHSSALACRARQNTSRFQPLEIRRLRALSSMLTISRVQW